MEDRVVCGLLAPTCKSVIRKRWNARFTEESMNAFFDCYTAKTAADLERTLGEMFHHDRRGYIIDPSLQKAIIPLLDRLDPSAGEEGSVDTVLNDSGVLCGYFLGDDDDRRLRLWFSSGHISS